ncbi:MAG: macrolide transporter [Bdellovibrionales bacterium RIFOXYD1_FULL_44_7]|nr:MAG: macrolide transporter [Bdellovibrionales bacterium RIFOXYD1_FULL_44_7]
MANTTRSLNKRKLWIILIVTAFIIAGISLMIWKNLSSKTKISYQPIMVERGDLEVTILSSGVVQPKNRLEIKPPIAGRAEQVLVREGDRVKKGQILAWMSSTERAALLDAARAKGEEEVVRWEQYYKATPVLAPIDGTIILRNVEAGQVFTNQDAVLVMSDRLSVKAQVDETDLGQIKIRQPAVITLDAYSDKAFDAKVSQIAFDAKTVNNVTTYEVDVVPDKAPSYMRSGMTANVRFMVASAADVLLVETQAVNVRDGVSSVQVRDEKGRVSDREVVTGLSDGKWTEIKSGLREGESVLTLEFKAGLSNPNSGSPFSSFGRKRSGNRAR